MQTQHLHTIIAENLMSKAKYEKSS